MYKHVSSYLGGAGLGVAVMQPGRAAKGMDSEDRAWSEVDATEVTCMKEVG